MRVYLGTDTRAAGCSSACGAQAGARRCTPEDASARRVRVVGRDGAAGPASDLGALRPSAAGPPVLGLPRHRPGSGDRPRDRRPRRSQDLVVPGPVLATSGLPGRPVVLPSTSGSAPPSPRSPHQRAERSPSSGVTMTWHRSSSRWPRPPARAARSAPGPRPDVDSSTRGGRRGYVEHGTAHALIPLSSTSVTGPSLTLSTRMSAPNAPLDWRPEPLELGAHRVVERLAHRPGRGRLPRRAAALARVAVQRELADHQHRGAHVARALLVAQQPQVPDLRAVHATSVGPSSWVTPR